MIVTRGIGPGGLIATAGLGPFGGAGIFVEIVRFTLSVLTLKGFTLER